MHKEPGAYRIPWDAIMSATLHTDGSLMLDPKSYTELMPLVLRKFDDQGYEPWLERLHHHGVPVEEQDAS